jgi:hypothetical protein
MKKAEFKVTGYKRSGDQFEVPCTVAKGTKCSHKVSDADIANAVKNTCLVKMTCYSVRGVGDPIKLVALPVGDNRFKLQWESIEPDMPQFMHRYKDSGGTVCYEDCARCKSDAMLS